MEHDRPSCSLQLQIYGPQWSRLTAPVMLLNLLEAELGFFVFYTAYVREKYLRKALSWQCP